MLDQSCFMNHLPAGGPGALAQLPDRGGPGLGENLLELSFPGIIRLRVGQELKRNSLSLEDY